MERRALAVALGLLATIVAGMAGYAQTPTAAPAAPVAAPAPAAAVAAGRRVVPRRGGAAVYESRPAQDRQLAMFSDPLRLAAHRAVREAGDRRGVQVVPDLRLDEAMSDLARSLRPGERVRSEAIEFVLGHHGIIEPYPRLAFVQGSGQHPRELLDALLLQISFASAGDLVTAGVGIDRDTSLVTALVALQDKALDLDPVPRTLATTDTIHLSGTLLGRMRAPTVEVTDPAGGVRKGTVTLDGRRFKSNLECGGKGKHQLEIFGTDERGPRVLANFPIYCGIPAPKEWIGAAGFTAKSLKPAEAQGRMLELLNRDRRGAGLPPLTLDPALSLVALAHSTDMLSNGFVGHISPTTGGPIDRVKRAGAVVPRRLMENVGAGSSIDDVEAGLMRSPGHRAAILDRQVTMVGIGIAISASENDGTPIFATQLFR
jgi:uncharacterized protein YkwD